ncbi:methyltransferase family protein [Nocardia pseudobrasiliensis]|uniref:Methyltransferase family protein n=1 Tax=Nocardia pseudobrasiliensis TaxID=45979 RepID=A0A370ICL2_9NOCA|nr:methyltransferase dimerization domain-containing protein [Nocardia pseudobrasiliensis]RDI68443.1 methyltransferase family protein [Nocardia pseudobrasiliensis]
MSDIDTSASAADREAPEGLTPIPLFQIVQGGWAASTLAAALEVGLFDAAARPGGLTRGEVAEQLGIEDRPADILLAACTSMGLLAKDGARYRNSPITPRS